MPDPGYTLTPVDRNPFARIVPDQGYALTPVDHDPFERPTLQSIPPTAPDPGASFTRGVGDILMGPVTAAGEVAQHGANLLTGQGDWAREAGDTIANALNVLPGKGVGEGMAAAAFKGVLLGPLGIRNLYGPMGEAVLAKADQLLARGASRAAIYNETGKLIGENMPGVFQGADKIWRMPLSDASSRLMDFPELQEGQSTTMGLGTAFRHPELYRAYPGKDEIPGLASRRVEVGRDPNTSGSQYPDAVGREPEFSVWGPNTAERKSATLHEIQHGIEDREGMAPGSDPDFIADRMKTLSVGPSDETKLQAKAYDIYHRHGGEADARLVERLRDLTPEELAQVRPWELYDVPLNKQIVPKSSAMAPRAMATDRVVGRGLVGDDGIVSTMSGAVPHYSVMKDGKEVAKAQVWAEPSFGKATVSHVQVADDFRRQGIASQLYDRIEKDMAQRGMKLWPDQALSEEAYRLWLKRNPEAVAARDYKKINNVGWVAQKNPPVSWPDYKLTPIDHDPFAR